MLGFFPTVGGIVVLMVILVKASSSTATPPTTAALPSWASACRCGSASSASAAGSCSCSIRKATAPAFFRNEKRVKFGDPIEVVTPESEFAPAGHDAVTPRPPEPMSTTPSFWLDQLGSASAAARAGGRPGCRRLHHRRRIHRAVDRVRARAGGPQPRRRGAGGPAGGLRRVGPQRRLGAGQGVGHGRGVAGAGRAGRAAGDGPRHPGRPSRRSARSWPRRTSSATGSTAAP